MTATATTTDDTINSILGIGETGPIAELRNQKPELADQLQTYYDALFKPTEESAAVFPLAERFLIAIRVASHTRSRSVADWYATQAIDVGIAQQLIDQILDINSRWEEQTPLGAAVRHADLVTTAPSQTSPENLLALKNAGYSPSGILSLAQTIAFVSYQLRLIAGLRAFGDQS